MDKPSLVTLKEVSKSYTANSLPAVASLSLTLEKGEILALLGPSGSGKTTTLRLIAGFEGPDEGMILVNGVPVAGVDIWFPHEAREIGMVFQDYSLFPHLTLLENAAFGFRIREKSARERIAMEIIEMV